MTGCASIGSTGITSDRKHSGSVPQKTGFKVQTDDQGSEFTAASSHTFLTLRIDLTCAVLEAWGPPVWMDWEISSEYILQVHNKRFVACWFYTGMHVFDQPCFTVCSLAGQCGVAPTDWLEHCATTDWPSCHIYMCVYIYTHTHTYIYTCTHSYMLLTYTHNYISCHIHVYMMCTSV